MKKTIALLIAITLSLTLFGCSKKSIELTTDNYSQYLEVRGGAYLSDYTTTYDSYSSFTASATAEAASDNYEYNNVKVTVKLSVTATPASYSVFAKHGEYDHTETHDYLLTINCNIGGSGSDGGKVKAVDFFEKNPGIDGINDHSYDFSYKMSVVDVSGTVTKVK